MKVRIRTYKSIALVAAIFLIVLLGGVKVYVVVSEPDAVGVDEAEIGRDEVVVSGAGTEVGTVAAVSVASTSAYVLYTVDGDTIAALVGTSTEPVRVRLIGVDTPEVVFDVEDGGVERSEGKRCYGEEAKGYVRELLTEQEVTLMSDGSQGDMDAYGRLLRYVFLNGENVNGQLIAEGYGREYTFKGAAYEYQQEFRAAEEQAREAERGLWSACR